MLHELHKSLKNVANIIKGVVKETKVSRDSFLIQVLARQIRLN